MNVPNENKVPFRDMTPDERSAIVERLIFDGGVDVFYDGKWVDAFGFAPVYSYRTKPRQLIIPWDVIKPEYKWAAMDSDCSLFVYDVEPNLSTHDWVRNGGLPECIDALNINTTGIDWRESLVQRPEGV